MPLTFSSLEDNIKQLAEILLKKQYMLATAESCTGGMLSVYLTQLAGASAWFKGAIIAYDNSIKQNLLKVPTTILENDGAVSEACATAMADGVLNSLSASVGVSITGIAGPVGGSSAKPVGTVCVGIAINNLPTTSYTMFFKGKREDIRTQACEFAVSELLNRL